MAAPQLGHQGPGETGRHNPLGVVDLDDVLGRLRRRRASHTRFGNQYGPTVQQSEMFHKRRTLGGDDIGHAIDQPTRFQPHGKQQHDLGRGRRVGTGRRLGTRLGTTSCLDQVLGSRDDLLHLSLGHLVQEITHDPP